MGKHSRAKPELLVVQSDSSYLLAERDDPWRDRLTKKITQSQRIATFSSILISEQEVEFYIHPNGQSMATLCDNLAPGICRFSCFSPLYMGLQVLRDQNITHVVFGLLFTLGLSQCKFVSAVS
jgi:hypothetical protein